MRLAARRFRTVRTAPHALHLNNVSIATLRTTIPKQGMGRSDIAQYHDATLRTTIPKRGMGPQRYSEVSRCDAAIHNPKTRDGAVALAARTTPRCEPSSQTRDMGRSA